MVVSAGVAAQYGHVYCGVVAGCSSVVSKNVLEDSLRTESWLAVALGAWIDRGFGEDVRMWMVVRVVDDRSEMQVQSCCHDRCANEPRWPAGMRTGPGWPLSPESPLDRCDCE